MLGPVLAGLGGGIGSAGLRSVAGGGGAGREAPSRAARDVSVGSSDGSDSPHDRSGSPPPLFVHELGVQLTVGTIAGFCSGYALKKVSKAAAVAIGIAFIAVQLARHNGLISDVDWAALEARLVASWDTDGDGRVSADDVRAHAQRAIDILGFNLPSGAAFAAAFIAGLRAG